MMRWHTAKSNAFSNNLILCSPFHSKKGFRSTYYCDMFLHGGPKSDPYQEISIFGEVM